MCRKARRKASGPDYIVIHTKPSDTSVLLSKLFALFFFLLSLREWKNGHWRLGCLLLTIKRDDFCPPVKADETSVSRTCRRKKKEDTKAVEIRAYFQRMKKVRCNKSVLTF